MNMENFNRIFAYLTANTTFALLLCLLRVEESGCSLNLFLDKNESHRFLGIPSEIYYIQAGKVRKNALNHVLKIPENYHTIHYTWERVTPSAVRYTIDVEIQDKKLLRSVTLNVSNQGVVPSTRETVMIQFACNGLQSARVIVNFNFKFTIENSSVIEITFKREKYCVKEAQKISFDVDQRPLMENSDSSQLKIFYIVLCFGCSLFTLLILCFLAYVVSNKKDSRQNSLHAEQQIRLRPTETENKPYILSASAINSGTSTSSNISHSSMKKRKNYTQLDNRSLDLQDRISEITIQRKRIRLQKIELEGTFGRVFVGTYSKEDGSEEEVVVKTVMDFASSNQISLLLREGLTMYGLKHRNIMSVLGVSIEDHVEPFVIYLREGFTNLKKYLQKCKLCQEGIARVLTTQEVVEIALQIISGVQYMHKKKLLHRDLATRNCLIRIRPPFRGHLSSYAAPFFLEYRRKNSARAKYDQLVRERLQQIATRSVEEQLQRGDVGLPAVDGTDTTSTSTRVSIATAPAVRVHDTNDEGSAAKRKYASRAEAAAAATAATFSDVRSTTNVEVIASLLADVANTAKRATSAVKPKVKRVASGSAKSATKTPRTALPIVRAAGKSDRNAATGDTKTATPNTPTKRPSSKATNATPAVTVANVRSAKPTDASPKEPIPLSSSASPSGAKADAPVPKSSEPAAAAAAASAADAADRRRRTSNLTAASDGAGETIKPTPAAAAAARIEKNSPKSRSLAAYETSPKSACKTPFLGGAKSKRTSTMSSPKPVKEPFSNPITFPPTTLPASLSQNEQMELMRRERRLERAWRELERRISKSVPFPLKAPEYLKQPPELLFEQTRTCELRRDLNLKRATEIEANKKFVRGKTPLKYIEPKPNLTQKLRYKQLKRKPIFSEFFERYYSKIDGSLNVKVADNALSRDLFPNDYHCLGDNENRPVQWLAIESLVDRTFSTASDVWSFGVTLWELTTLGQQPYVEVDPFEIEHYLKDGYRLSQPVNCPDELFAVMAYCWAMSADERPTFSQLLTCLQDFRNQLNKYV